MADLARDIRRAGLLTVALFLAAWAIASAVSVLSASRNLEAARGQLANVEGLLREAELTLAREELTTAVSSAASAAESLNSWHLAPARAVPFVGPNLQAARTLSGVARDVGRDLGELLDVAAVIVSDDRSQDVGEVSIEYIGELAPPTRQLVTTLQRATIEVSSLDPDPLVGRISSARTSFLELVEPNLAQAIVVADLLEVMPGFLGEAEPRRYLVGAAALSELRASGGLLGSWTVMSADEGRMVFDDFIDVDELPQPTEPATSPSEDYERRYGRWGALTEWRNANLTPDFPSAAEVLLDRYERGGGSEIDGVIVADTVVLERLAARSGGLEVPGVGWLAPEDTLRFVGLDAYDTFEDDDERKLVLGATATAAFAELFQILEDDNVPRTLEMLADISQGGHLSIYARDAQVQSVLRRAGVTGELRPRDGESAGIFVNNFGENTVDYFAERSVRHEVRLLPEGMTEATFELTLGNQAPREGHRRAVLGPWIEGLEPGDARSLVTFSCGTGCEVLERPAASQDGGTERSRAMVDELIIIPADGTADRRFVTRSRGSWRVVADEVVLEVAHRVQPTIQGTELEVSVEVPTGYEVVATTAGAEVAADRVTWRSTTSGDQTFTVRFMPGSDEAGLLP